MMDSFVFSDDEARYLQAVLKWQGSNIDEERKRKLAFEAEHEARRKKAVGEFRILVTGAQGTGKTAILTRFAEGTFRNQDEPADPFYDRGCRRTAEIDGQYFTVDALEMPSKHLSSNPMLLQAVNITEASVIVYDVTSAESLRLASELAAFIRDSVGNREYGLMLIGNKIDEARVVPLADGQAAADACKLAGSDCLLMEVSAKTGENVGNIFPVLGKQILQLKLINQQRRELADRMAMAMQSPKSPITPAKRKKGLWRSLVHPFLRRQTAHSAA